MKQRDGLPRWFALLATAAVLLAANGMAQTAPQMKPQDPNAAMTAAITALQEQVKELRQAVGEIKAESAQYRAETTELRQELDAAKAQLAKAQPQTANQTSAMAEEENAWQAKPLAQRVASLENSVQLLNTELGQQDQTKVESASKYKVRLSGIVLMNLFSDRGALDNQDFPSLALRTGQSSGAGSLGATARQTEIGLEVFGPEIAGAKTSGSLRADFAGGFPNTWNGVNYGQFRLRTAFMRMDWENTSLVAGQDDLFISPLSPTSLASLAIPAFSYSGNLWGWVPQIRVEHRYDFRENRNVTVQGGVFDNVTGEYPAYQYNRQASAGERTGQPGYGARVAWSMNLFGQPMTVGAAGYYSRQDWEFGRHVDGWAGMTDWGIPLPGRLSLSGEFYRGRAVGGLGGGIGRSVGSPDDPALATTPVYGLSSMGGWSQLKLRATAKLEFNAAFGLDNPDAGEARSFAPSQIYASPVWVQNGSAFANFIYRPRSDLMFSTEYRKLRTRGVYPGNYDAGQINMGMGILF